MLILLLTKVKQNKTNNAKMHIEVLDELQPNQWPMEAGNCAIRCTGVALSMAAGLLCTGMLGTGARIIALLGGPCTDGPGMVKIPLLFMI